MPIYRLDDTLLFPPVSAADPGGILAVGGDLSPERLLRAYHSGIFPWYSDGEPIMWWSPDPRLVLFPARVSISESMHRLLRARAFEVTFDRAFGDVVARCRSAPREGQDGTWITADMLQAYGRLHAAGHAHSVEVWRGGKLVGGLYGVALGGCFCGESMFAAVSNASKFGFICLVHWLEKHGFGLIDCQVPTPHLQSLGAEEVSRSEFMELLVVELDKPTWPAPWTYDG